VCYTMRSAFMHIPGIVMSYNFPSTICSKTKNKPHNGGGRPRLTFCMRIPVLLFTAVITQYLSGTLSNLSMIISASIAFLLQLAGFLRNILTHRLDIRFTT